MRYFALVGLLAASATCAQTVPATGPAPASFIPHGYQVLRGLQATGDLNGDGRPDVVLALTSVAEASEPTADNPPPRLLLVLWRTAAGSYRRAAVAQRLLLHSHAAPYGGDPLNGLAIRRGVLLVQYDTGGNWGRSTTARFRYQRGGFYLIGERNAYGTHHPDCDNLSYPPRYDYSDANFLTGKYEVVKVSDECRLLQHKRGRRPLRPLRPLANYAPEP